MRASWWVPVLIAVAWPALASAATEPNTLVNPLVPASNCAGCHNPPNAEIHAAETTYAPVTTWQSSMMGNSARDPVFWAAIAIASQDQGDAFGETELCIRCHAPRAFLEGRGAALSIDALQPADRAGVECELCHRMQVDSAGMSSGPGNAQYTIDDVLVGANVPRRGPWTYDDTDPYPPPHSWMNDPSMGSSALCGTCHDVTTPRQRLDDDGNPIGLLFNEQRTYSEWLGSAYATVGATMRTCQDCHMPAVDDMAACVANTNETSHPTGGRRHTLAGANWFMMDVLDRLYGDQGSGEVPSASYAQTQDEIAGLLATAATIELAPPEAVDLGAGLHDLGVRVTNETGHKLPTGYPEGRLMWLEVTARYGDAVVFSSGSVDQALGRAPDPLLRTYRAVAEQYASGEINHLLLNDHWIEDTRIPPLGLAQSIQTDPVGDRYEVLPDGTWPNYDDYVYDFEGAPDIVDATPADSTDDVLAVEIRLMYMVNTPEYIEFLADTNVTNEAGMDIAALFEELGGSPPLELAVASVEIPIASFGPVDGTSSGGGSSSDDGSEPTSGPDEGTSGGSSTPTSTSTSTSATASGGTEGTGDTDTDTDTGGGAEGGDGCGCRSGGGSGWTLSLVPMLLLGRTRRRTRALTRPRRREGRA